MAEPMSETSIIIMELEQMPDAELDYLAAIEIMDDGGIWKYRPRVTLDVSSYMMLYRVIQRVHSLGLFPEFFGCLYHCMPEDDFQKICGIPDARLGDVHENDWPFLLGMSLMVQSPRKLVIAALAAKRLSEVSPVGACDGVPPYPPRPHTPLVTAALDVTKHGTDLEIMEHECPKDGDL